MNRKHLLWIAPWIAFGLGACATVQRTDTSKACAEWRWIAVSSTQAAACPEIPGWDRPRPLFTPREAPNVQDRYVYVKGERVIEQEETAKETAEALRQLERFCVYETDKKLGRVQLPPLEDGKLVRVDQDCAAISVAGEEWKPFSKNFLFQAGTPNQALQIKNRRGVRLAFLDTHPTGVVVPAERPTGRLTSEHGYTLAHMARNLICSPEKSDECAALITTRLALPIQSFHPKSRRLTKIAAQGQGGIIGTQGDLAKAIRDEVDAWRNDLGTPDAPQKLVLNLSVAWDGELFGGLDEEQVAELRAGTQAVYWALRYAASFDDVLVLAAAGNACKTCEKKSVGPLLPAAWEDSPPAGESAPPRTLVYAVGGVDAEGRPLRNARENGMPRRAAYGTSGVVPALTHDHSTHMYTGTSVSTAVVSSVAAIVWDTLPDHSPEEIMGLLEESGDDLTARYPDVRTNFAFGVSSLTPGGMPPPVRRISLCPALRRACREPEGKAGCPLQNPETDCVTWQPARYASTPLQLGTCHPWVHTQPPDYPCPICEPPRY